jgi:hypothetical protein
MVGSRSACAKVSYSLLYDTIIKALDRDGGARTISQHTNIVPNNKRILASHHRSKSKSMQILLMKSIRTV